MKTLENKDFINYISKISEKYPLKAFSYLNCIKNPRIKKRYIL